jgi:hypothetical protein
LMFGHKHAVDRGAERVVDGGFRAVWDRMKSWFQGSF